MESLLDLEKMLINLFLENSLPGTYSWNLSIKN
jgi:hypothetical protein